MLHLTIPSVYIYFPQYFNEHRIRYQPRKSAVIFHLNELKLFFSCALHDIVLIAESMFKNTIH